MGHKNRKRTETYRFNGYPHLNRGSIRPLYIKDLLERLEHFRKKLADPKDPDDPRWVSRWIRRLELELRKKERGLRFRRGSRD